MPLLCREEKDAVFAAKGGCEREKTAETGDACVAAVVAMSAGAAVPGGA